MLRLRQNFKGTILMEVLVVLGIIAVLTTVAIPYIKKYQPNLKLHSSARDLTTDIRYAQQLTVTEQKVHLVNFDIVQNKYEIIKIDSATTTIKSVDLDPEVSFKTITDLTDDQIIFNFYGGVSESGQIVLTNTNSMDSTINIKPSGYIQLEE